VAFSLAEQIAASAGAAAPNCPPRPKVRFGGIDPLGLRQINFDRVDLVFPGVNNVARRIRPFTVAAWAWHRAAWVAEESGKAEVAVSTLQDFQARIEVIFVWSQFLLNLEAELPGIEVFAKLISADAYRFGGKDWVARRRVRRLSTAISSPINYGPSLKSLGWVRQHDTQRGIMLATHQAMPAVLALEKRMAEHLDHPAFSRFGPVTVTHGEVRRWAKAWTMDKVTAAERDFMRDALCGPDAPDARRFGVQLAQAVAEAKTSDDPPVVRRRMCLSPPGGKVGEALAPAAMLWKRVQHRQLFRLALEALYYWVRLKLTDGPRTMRYLVKELLDQAGCDPSQGTTSLWLAGRQTGGGPVALLEAIESSMAAGGHGLEARIVDGIALALREPSFKSDETERNDRLPLAKARREAVLRGTLAPSEFVRHVLESWILSQHVYWSVWRGLADARAGTKSILRLKIMLESAGWTLAPDAPLRPPRRAGDRLETILSLGTECGMINIAKT
jgi:hypothetical protein